ncbi:PilZ domain-containing protein [Nitrospira moscoviensis]|uniref:PilZ domain-containing protein n=1 Tax=Nitrospira moscoviensis TaxID=42253 RepID=A0A0K2GBJ3_NITMO|nr:PilZ domain-containing protein [Nitrospira moscoviensis]ALA58318.1 hypothetical protein NITMOv2_1898 [Nitrospira moscoviensis]
MTNRIHPMRRHSRFPVRWPVVYGDDEFVSEGTVLDVTHIGWRIAGSMLVSPGMRLTLQLQIPGKTDPVRVERAAVLWVRQFEFAIEVEEMAPADQAWLTDFLEEKLGLAWQTRAGQRPPSSRVEPADMKACTAHQRTGPADMLEPEPLAASYRLMQEIGRQSAQRLFQAMESIKAQRARTGRDIVAEN